MKKIFLITTLLLVSVLSVSCKTETLQGYLIEKQDDSKFITFDFSTNILPIQLNEKASEEDKKTINSVKKVNIVFLPKNKASEIEIQKEKATIQAILKTSTYKKLISFKKKGINFNAYYTGEADAIDEMIISGYGKEFGVGVARMLGEKMNPSSFMRMMQSGSFKLDSSVFKKIKDLQ